MARKSTYFWNFGKIFALKIAKIVRRYIIMDWKISCFHRSLGISIINQGIKLRHQKSKNVLTTITHLLKLEEAAKSAVKRRVGFFFCFLTIDARGRGMAKQKFREKKSSWRDLFSYIVTQISEKWILVVSWLVYESRKSISQKLGEYLEIIQYIYHYILKEWSCRSICLRKELKRVKIS